MKIALIYYSLTGNTEYIAKKISNKISVDLYKIQVVSEYPKNGFKKFLYCGKSAVFEENILIKCDCDLDKYNYIILGTPIWASNITPTLRSFINKNFNSFNNKRISVFLSFSGGGEKRTLNKLKECLKVDSFEHELILKSDVNNDNKIEEFIKSICESI